MILISSIEIKYCFFYTHSIKISQKLITLICLKKMKKKNYFPLKNRLGVLISFRQMIFLSTFSSF